MRKGIDISHHQTVTSWQSVADAASFVYCKTSEGRGQDPKFRDFIAGAREQAMSVGAYHFFRPDVTIQSQMAALTAQCEAVRIGDGDLAPCLDVEEEPPLVFSEPVYRSGVEAMIKAMISEWGRCVVYTSQYYWHRIGNPEILLDPKADLWVSHYTTNVAPAVPLGKVWSLWQYSGSGTTAGIAGQVDQNVAAVLPVLGRADHSAETLALVGETLRREAQEAWERGDL